MKKYKVTVKQGDEQRVFRYCDVRLVDYKYHIVDNEGDKYVIDPDTIDAMSLLHEDDEDGIDYLGCRNS